MRKVDRQRRLFALKENGLAVDQIGTFSALPLRTSSLLAQARPGRTCAFLVGGLLLKAGDQDTGETS